MEDETTGEKIQFIRKKNPENFKYEENSAQHCIASTLSRFFWVLFQCIKI